MENEDKLSQWNRYVEQRGEYIAKELHGIMFKNTPLVSKDVNLLLCLRGSARAKYDMQEINVARHTLCIFMPGHVLESIDFTDDYTFAYLTISDELFKDLKMNLFSHDYDKFNYEPACRLTDIQAKRLLAMMELLDAIASHDMTDLQLRRQMLLSQLALGYEFVNYYRREQDKDWSGNRYKHLYSQFCDLVVEHYKENRNVNYYAQLMGYEPRYFAKIFRQSNRQGLTPLEWIQQYVVTQAKLLMDTRPDLTIKETAFELGFPTTANFCRYFKRSAGIYPQAYKEKGTPPA